MLKRDVPTGPAADLLRLLLETGDINSHAVPKVRELLAGKPLHAALPLAYTRNGNPTPQFNLLDASKERVIGTVNSKDDGDLICLAVNNFYVLRDAALEAYNATIEGRLPGFTVGDIDEIAGRLRDCGADVKTALDVAYRGPVQARPPVAPIAPPPAPVAPGPAMIAPFAPVAPLPPDTRPLVGSLHQRLGTQLFHGWGLYLTGAEVADLEAGRALPNPN